MHNHNHNHNMYKKYKKYKKLYKSIKYGGTISSSELEGINRNRRAPLDLKSEFALLNSSSFRQYLYNNRLITIIGEYHLHKCVVSHDRELKTESITEYCVDSSGNKNTKLMLEYHNSVDPSQIHSHPITELTSLQQKHNLNIIPIDFRKSFLKPKKITFNEGGKRVNKLVDPQFLLYGFDFNIIFHGIGLQQIQTDLLNLYTSWISSTSVLNLEDGRYNQKENMLLTEYSDIIIKYFNEIDQKLNSKKILQPKFREKRDTYLQEIRSDLQKGFLYVMDFFILKILYEKGNMDDIIIVVGEYHSINLHKHLLTNTNINNIVDISSTIPDSCDNLVIRNSY